MGHTIMCDIFYMNVGGRVQGGRYERGGKGEEIWERNKKNKLCLKMP